MRDVMVGGALALTAIGGHTFGITLPFYRRVCPVCKRTGWAKCDRATHEKERGDQA